MQRRLATRRRSPSCMAHSRTGLGGAAWSSGCGQPTFRCRHWSTRFVGLPPTPLTWLARCGRSQGECAPSGTRMAEPSSQALPPQQCRRVGLRGGVRPRRVRDVDGHRGTFARQHVTYRVATDGVPYRPGFGVRRRVLHRSISEEVRAGFRSLHQMSRFTK